MSVDYRESVWEIDGELRVESDRVQVEGGYLESSDVRIDGREYGWIERRGDQNEGVWREDLVLDCPRLEGLPCR